MSETHPVIAVTGSSGTATPEVRTAFEHILSRTGGKAVFVQGDAYHCLDRGQMREEMKKHEQKGDPYFSHFRPSANCVDELEALFSGYGHGGKGRHRVYVHTKEDAARQSERFGKEVKPGDLTPWEDIPADTDMLLYQGLHGMLRTEDNDVAAHVDLGIGLVPIINLEWIQKIVRDQTHRGYRKEEVVASILRRMPDFVHYITPQFSRTDINFQRVPVVDTSDPFSADDIPGMDESLMVIRFRKPARFGIDFPKLVGKIPNARMSRRNSLVIPGGETTYAMELILEPIIADLLARRRNAVMAEA